MTRASAGAASAFAAAWALHLTVIAQGQAPPAITVEQLLVAGHFKRVAAIAEPRLAANPRDAQALYLVSRVRTLTNDAANALLFAERAVAIEPNTSRYHQQLATAVGLTARSASIFSAPGLISRFTSEIDKAIALDPANLDARRDILGYYLVAPTPFGSVAKAKLEADEILKRDRGLGLMAWADVASAEKDEKRAEEFMRQAVQASPASYEARDKLARYYVAEPRARYDDATAQANEMKRMDPGRVGAYWVLASANARQGHWADLDKVLTESERYVPDDRMPHFVAGLRLLNAQMDPQRAAQLFRRYLEQPPELGAAQWSRAHWRLGQALERTGQNAAAITEWETALGLEPTLTGARDDLKRLRR